MRTQPAKAKPAAPLAEKAKISAQPPPETAVNPAWTRLALGIHPKLAVSAPGDPAEQEADRIADTVMRSPEPVVQRKCAACSAGGASCPSCEEEEHVQRKADGRSGAGEVGSDFASRLGGGAPLDADSRAFFEPRFGRDFGDVRVHADAQAADAARSVDARAFALGRNVVFAAGEYAPRFERGRSLLAHELVHVVQQREAATRAHEPRRIFRQPVPGADASNMSVADGGELELAALLVQITNRTRRNQQFRQQLDALPDASSPEREVLAATLNAGRTDLIALLEERINLLELALADLWLRELGPAPQSSLNDVRSDVLGNKLVSYESQLEQHRNQLKPLLRWQTRQQIEAIDTELAQIDEELARLPQVSDPSAPEADLLAARRADLEAQRKTLVKSLSSSAVEYKQFDSRWGAIRYGTDPKCTNIKAAGCGPTSLAILLNYLYSEDPEALKPGPIEFVTPKETAAYGATHGRICNNGTSGPTMVTQVSTQWPGFRGKGIKLAQAIIELQNGNLVIFLCHSCTGKNKSGGDKKYGGHFMVLNGVDDAGKVFNVLDPGASEAGDIETITKAELSSHTNGFWIVTRK